MILKASHIWDNEVGWLSCLAVLGSKQIVLLCIVIQLVKMLTSLASLTWLSYQEMQDSYSLCFAVNPESVKEK